MPINKGGVEPVSCCEEPTPYVPPTFEQNLEWTIKRSITQIAKAQEALEFVKKNTEVFSQAKELGINFYIE